MDRATAPKQTTLLEEARYSANTAEQAANTLRSNLELANRRIFGRAVAAEVEKEGPEPPSDDTVMGELHRIERALVRIQNVASDLDTLVDRIGSVADTEGAASPPRRSFEATEDRSASPRQAYRETDHDRAERLRGELAR